MTVGWIERDLRTQIPRFHYLQSTSNRITLKLMILKGELQIDRILCNSVSLSLSRIMTSTNRILQAAKLQRPIEFFHGEYYSVYNRHVTALIPSIE